MNTDRCFEAWLLKAIVFGIKMAKLAALATDPFEA
jgi:hypothetical protein